MKPALIPVLSIALFFCSCSKEDKAAPPPVYNQNFKWVLGTAPLVADSSVALLNGFSGKPTILGWNRSNVVGTFKIVFALRSFTLGGDNIMRTVNPPNPLPPITTTNNLYYYDDNGTELAVVNGSINILFYANGRVSGNFTVNLQKANGDPLYLVGSFTDIPVKP